MLSFTDWLATLRNALLAFDDRSSGPDETAAVRYEPSAEEGFPGEILIGVGHSAKPHSMHGVCLNNKVAAGIPGLDPNLSSVTVLVQQAPDTLIAGWVSALGIGSDPEAILLKAKLVVEDASPDSCFGFLCFLARAAGVLANDLPTKWIAYVDAWERGGTGHHSNSAYGPLHNALTHLTFEDRPTTAWSHGLHLLVEALWTGLEPHALGPRAGGPWLARARAAFAADAQAYEENLRHAVCVQLSVPLADAPDRRKLVDACLVEEAMSVGATKDFARADHACSTLGQGFTLLGIYRPTDKGSGNDMVISTDPTAMLDLRALWVALEDEEDRRWGAARPNDRSRVWDGYPSGKRSDGTAAPTEPWFITRDFSLVAPPKRLPSGIPGTKLSWPGVCETVWHLYQPLRDVRFHQGLADAVGEGSGATRPLHECTAEAFGAATGVITPAATQDRLFIARWHRPDNTVPAFRITPTLCRCLAHCVIRPPGEHGPIRLSNLPADDMFEILELRGGLAVIADQGAFLLNGGMAQRPPLAELAAVFHDASETKKDVRNSRDKITGLLEDTRSFLHGETTSPDGKRTLTAETLLAELAHWQVRIARAQHQEHVAVLTPLARRFRAALLARWGITDWISRLARDVEEIKEALANHTGQEINQRIAFLQAYGLPVVAGASLFGFVFQGLKAPLDGDWSGVNWKGLVLYVVIVALGCLIMRLISAVSKRQARKALEDVERR